MKAWICCVLMASAASGGILPVKEEAILKSVAEQYRLTHHQTKLLMTIRRIENGRSGLELGVGDGIPNHPARRFAGHFEKSLRLQAEWAAGTILKRYNGDLTRFAQKYCPVNWQVWARNAGRYMKMLGGQDVQVAQSESNGRMGDADTINPRLPDSAMFRREG